MTLCHMFAGTLQAMAILVPLKSFRYCAIGNADISVFSNIHGFDRTNAMLGKPSLSEGMNSNVCGSPTVQGLKDPHRIVRECQHAAGYTQHKSFLAAQIGDGTVLQINCKIDHMHRGSTKGMGAAQYKQGCSGLLRLVPRSIHGHVRIRCSNEPANL